MKTFSEYIREAVDFRLGGSQNKGDGIKSFASLLHEDNYWSYKITLNKTLNKISTCEINKFVLEKTSQMIMSSKKKTIELQGRKGKKGKRYSLISTFIPEEYEDKNIYVHIDMQNERDVYIASTYELSDNEIVQELKQIGALK